MLNIPRQGLKAGLPVWKAVARNPIKVTHYLYFLGSQQVTTDGGAVSSWADAGLSTLTRTLAQSTANLQPAHDTSDEHLTFDTTTGEKDKLAFDVAVAQAGVLVCATSNGIFAYEVDADSVDEITALGFETGYFQALDLYAYILFPSTITAVELAGVIRYLDENTNATKNPVGDLTSYWRGRTDLVTPKFGATDLSGVTNFSRAWQQCSSLTSMPAIALTAGTDFTAAWYYDTSLTSFLATGLDSGTNFSNAWDNCSALATFPAIPLTAGTNFTSAWQSCTSLTSFLATGFDTGSAIDFSQAWQSCTALVTFPAISLASGTSFNHAWRDCTSMTTFSATGLDSGTVLSNAWYGCTALATMPAIPLTAGLNFNTTWYNCTALTSFLATGLDSGTNFTSAWSGCSSLATMPAIPLTAGTNFANAWFNNASLTSFLATGLDSGTVFGYAWYNCNSLATFPAIPLTAGTNFNNAWSSCTSLTSFLATGLNSGTNFQSAWQGCSALASFPALDLSSGTNFNYTWKSCPSLATWNTCTFSSDSGDSLSFAHTWYSCTALTSFPSDVDMSRATSCDATWYNTRIVSFPALDLSLSTNFGWAFANNASMVSWGACNMNKGLNFSYAWQGNSALTTFPAGVFDDWNPTSITTNCFKDTWDTCTALTEQSVENILLSISASGQWATSTGTSSGTPLAGKEITIDSNNVNVDNLSASNRAACTALQSRGWEVVINGSVVSEYALSFNGTDERVEFSTPTPFSGQTLNTFDCTLSAWAKYDTIAQYEAIICLGAFDLEIAPTSTTEVGIWVDNAAYGGAVYAPTMGVWNHYVATKSGNTYTLYVNGVQIGQNDDADNATVGVTSFIGNNSESNYLDGDIDEVAIWDEALDAAAVLAVYNAGQPINLNRDKGNYDNSDDIVSWWRMGDSDSGAGNFVTDVIATDGEALHLPAVNLNYASVPDAADLDGFGNFTFELTDVTVPDWTPTGTNTLISKYASASKSWVLQLLTTGKLGLYLSFDGSAETGYLSSVVTGITDGATASIRVIRSGTSLTFELDTGSGYSQLGTTVTVSASAIHAGTRDVMIGTHETASVSMFGGSIGRARIWSDATQSTNALDINFALANKGATSFTATSGQVVTINSTAIDNPAAIRSATDGVLVNSPTFVVDNPPNYSDYSLTFNGTNHYATSSADGTRADKTYSFWAKNTSTATNTVFAHGAANAGAFHFNWSSMPLLYLGTSYYRFWADTPAQDDGAWHHWAVVVDESDPTSCLLYVDGVLQTPISTLTTGAVLDYADITIGRSTAGQYFGGSIDEFAVFDGHLTSAQINDLYNAGRPATITGAEHWWRMGEDNAGTGVTISDMGSGSDNLTLVNTPTFSRSVPAEDATWNNRSLTFVAASSEHMTTTADDTLATKSYSFWAKSSDTAANGVFDHGGGDIGAFTFNNSADKAILYLGQADYFRYWDVNAAQDDGAWHHHVVYLEHDDITNCKWYVDGVLQTPSTTYSSGSASAYTTGLRLGRGQGYFDGNLDEFAIFDGELTPSQILQIYNGGKPASLKEFSPESWWRMGDDDDTGGTTIRDLGVVSTTELVTNGEFLNNITGWTDISTGSGASIAWNAAGYMEVIGVNLSNRGTATTSFTTVVGGSYTFKATITNRDNFGVKVGTSSGGTQIGYAGIMAVGDGTHQYSFVATSTTTWITFQENANSTTQIDNVSVKQDNLVLNGGFDTDTIWNKGTGVTIAGGKAVWTNTGNNIGVTQTACTPGVVYEVTFTVSDYSSGSVRVRYPFESATKRQANGTYTESGLATSVSVYIQGETVGGNPTFKVDNVSVKEINGNPATLVNTPTFSTDTP